MSNLFEGSDSELEFKTDSEYAKNYDKWRKKEELNKLKTKYGEQVDSEESSSESDEEIELTEKAEKDFFKILACLKSKDPKIYDENVKFFDDEDNIKIKDKKSKPLYIKDYERNLLLEKEGILSDDESDTSTFQTNTTNTANTTKQEKENIIKSINMFDEEDDEQFLEITKRNKSSKKQIDENQEGYKEWLAGQKYKLNDKMTEIELKPLKDYWNKSNLDEGEKFVRDYILLDKFLEKEDHDYIPTYEEIVHDSDQNLSNDEETIEKQEEFEHKYNFRFEEPDEEFIKRYPRTIENSLRQKDNKRQLKRQEVKERKKKEKQEKMQELKKLQELKGKEIEEKLEKLQEITGSTKLNFNDEDVENDFDPEKYDQRMQELFNEEFYKGVEGDQKPKFSDIDDELEIENYQHFEEEQYDPHCEDQEFNMDADYDPNSSFKTELNENSTNKKKRKRKSKFTEAVNKPKPKFNPNDKTYEEYFDEYYKLDCEDFIGDIPCRFKYKKVVPNNFGLSIEEILTAKDRELNKWCSLKKAVQIRPDHVEKYEQIAYQKKGQNITLKKKILPSLFNTDDAGTSTPMPIENIFKKTELITTHSQARADEESKLTNSNDEKKITDNIQIEDIIENKQKQQKIENLSTSQEIQSFGKAKVANKKNKNKKRKLHKKINHDQHDNYNKNVEIQNSANLLNLQKVNTGSEIGKMINKNKKQNKLINDKQNVSRDKNVQTEKNKNKKRKLEDHVIEQQGKKFKKTELDKNPILAISDQRVFWFNDNLLTEHITRKNTSLHTDMYFTNIIGLMNATSNTRNL